MKQRMKKTVLSPVGWMKHEVKEGLEVCGYFRQGGREARWTCSTCGNSQLRMDRRTKRSDDVCRVPTPGALQGNPGV